MEQRSKAFSPVGVQSLMDLRIERNGLDCQSFILISWKQIEPWQGGMNPRLGTLIKLGIATGIQSVALDVARKWEAADKASHTRRFFGRR